MGVGLGFAIAAAMVSRHEGWVLLYNHLCCHCMCPDNILSNSQLTDWCQGQKVVCVEGDSAFGFSGMEMETIIRYRLPVCLLIINNNGIYSGLFWES